MLSSLYSGISGLLTNSESISVIGNNISNVNTVGYKSQSTAFQDMLYQSIQSASGTSQVGRGAILAAVSTSFSQGSFETTTSATDLAIGGQGFFIVKAGNSNTNYYTRAGGFSFDSNGNLTNSAGYILQGKIIDRTTNTASGVDTDINVSSQPSEPKATGKIGMVVNLKSDADWKGTITQPAAGGNVTQAENSAGQYPMVGNYTVVTALRTASGTGTNTVGTSFSGSMNINGFTVSLTGVTSAATLAAAINGTAGINVTAAAVGGRLQLTANAAGKDIVIDTSSTTGDIGWTSADKASTGLYGASASVTVDRMLRGVSQGTTTYAGNISVAAGTATNVGGSGLDLTNRAITAGGTQTFTISGFSPTTQSASVTPSTTSDYSSSVTVYDSLGQSHVVNVYFRKSYTTASPQTSVWEYHAQLSASDSATGTDVDVAAGYLTFNDSGTLISGGDPIPISFDFSNGASPNQPIDLVFGSQSGGGTTTQYPIASTTDFQTQDGYPPGTLTSISVNTEGVMSGTYSNGQIIDLYQITLANFNNPQGLTRMGVNLYSETLESGVPYTNAPGEGGLGNINSNSLEQSNVDLATEFVKMIVAERGYQANSKVITTTDEMLQELMQIKR
jgi:flagellar hook protein FlgE